MNAVQAAQRLLDYIGNMGLYVDAHTYSEAFPKRLHRLFMKIHSVDGEPQTLAYEGRFGISGCAPSSDVNAKIKLTPKRAQVLLPLLRAVALNKAVVALRAEQERQMRDTAAEIVAGIEKHGCDGDR